MRFRLDAPDAPAASDPTDALPSSEHAFLPGIDDDAPDTVAAEVAAACAPGGHGLS